MAKRHSLADDIISGRPLSAVPAPDAKPVDTAPRRPRKLREPAPRTRRELTTVPVRLWGDQRKALVDEAMKRAELSGSGRLDASSVMREFFDGCFKAWLEER